MNEWMNVFMNRIKLDDDDDDEQKSKRKHLNFQHID